MLMQEPIWVLGTMSGTSLDGVDAAMILTDGHEIQEIGRGAYRPYTPAERDVLRAALGHWSGPEVARAQEVVTQAHLALLADLPRPALVGFHGQTLAHDPGGRGTLQVGDGPALAQALGCPVISDFRSADVAAGGQGAPLAPFYHFAMARHARQRAPLVLLNLGGVGNLTWIDPRRPVPEGPDALLAFDTGPANAPINDLMQQRRGCEMDKGGALAASGQVSEPLVQKFMENPYFSRAAPKSLDRDDFPSLLQNVIGLSDADAAATLTAIVAESVARGLGACPTRPEALFVTGGGRHNPALMAQLAERCGLPPKPVESLGFDGDLVEAQAFAYLAARVVHGLPTSAPGTTGVTSPICGGQLSTPHAA